MPPILIGSQNAHKQGKLAQLVEPYFARRMPENAPDFEEVGESFEEIAKDKALKYAKWCGGLAISADGGAVIPALNGDEWEPLRTRRFGKNDQERIQRLLELMENKEDRTVQWFEAIAIATPEKVLFSTTAQAMEGIIDRTFCSEFYREGIWLCSITSFPTFEGRNFFELTSAEQRQTEDSWDKLADSVADFLNNEKVLKEE